MKTKEVIEALNIKKDTLHKWIKDFDLSIQKNDKGNYDFSDNDIEKLKEIINLRGQDNGINTIQKKLDINKPVDKPFINLDKENKQDYKPFINENKINEMLQNSLISIENSFSDKMDSSIKQMAILSEKLSNYSYKLGSLESENKNLNEKINMITESKNKEISYHENKLSEAEKQRIESEKKIKELEALNNEIAENLLKEKNKNWFQRLFKK
jgi:DNA-binding transcriptional MerR regulator